MLLEDIGIHCQQRRSYLTFILWHIASQRIARWPLSPYLDRGVNAAHGLGASYQRKNRYDLVSDRFVCSERFENGGNPRCAKEDQKKQGRPDRAAKSGDSGTVNPNKRNGKQSEWYGDLGCQWQIRLRVVLHTFRNRVKDNFDCLGTIHQSIQLDELVFDRLVAVEDVLRPGKPDENFDSISFFRNIVDSCDKNLH